jgi:hypothetical protein
VVPTGWTVVHRPDDGETVGYLAPTTGGLVQPVDLAGAPVGPPGAPDAAARLLAARGLGLLAGRRWCRLPVPLPRGVSDAAEPGPDWSWRPVLLVEVSPDAVRVRPELPDPEELGAQARLPVPVGDLLLADPPG